MSELNKHRIRRFRKHILNDIQEDVIEDLEKLNVLTKLEIQQLNNVDNFKEKMEHFLDIILEKPYSDVEHFVKSLKVWYSWLFDLIINPNHNISSKSLHEDLIRGGVPPLPHRNITRTVLLDRLRERVMDINYNQYLVLHGMLGCGKSSLASEILNFDGIIDLCRGQIFWITVGSEGEKNIQSLQERLNAVLPEPEPNLPEDVDVALIHLKKKFSAWEYGKDALIILDDVHSEKVVDCLSVGAKCLITTEDENIISDNKKSITIFEKIPDGFEEEESLALLASSIGIKTYELPLKAKSIHKFSKGHPMIVTLISAQLEDHKEQVVTDDSRWDYYIKLFSDKSLKRRSFDENGTLNNAIRVSIESMEPRMIKYFEHFVIFLEDVNIKPEVLSIFWTLNVHDVQNLMMEFVRKSLIVRQWNNGLQSYVYGIHDLILRYLKCNLNKEYIQSLHRKFVQSYMNMCNGDLSTLQVEDNYIFYYIGSHLRSAEMYDLFPQLYFNFEFIEMKLRKAGPADLIMDMKRYRNFIINGQFEVNNVEKFNHLLNFVELYGSWIHKGLDIAQLALQECKDTYIYRCGQDLTKKRHHRRPYVLLPLGPHNKKKIIPQMLKIKKDISTVCFANSPYFVLVGTALGNIELWDLKSKLIKRKYNEHTGLISTMKVDSVSLNYFLSTSNDGSVKVWPLLVDALSGDRTPSPRDRQENYSELWSTSIETGEKALKNLEHSGPVFWAAFPQLPNSSLLVTVSHPSTVTLWEETKKKWQVVEDDAKTCEMCHSDLWVVVGGLNRISIYGVNTPCVIHTFNWNVKFLYTLPENGGGSPRNLLMVSDDRIDVLGVADVNQTIVPSEISPTESYTCCSVNYHIALGTNRNNVRVCHRHTGETLAKFSENRIGADLVDIGLTDGALITAFNDKTLFLWPLDDVVSPVSSISWPTSEIAPLISTAIHGNSIQVCNGRDMQNEFSVEGEILNIVTSNDGKFIGVNTSLIGNSVQIMNTCTSESFKCTFNLTMPLKYYVFNYNEQAIVAYHTDRSRVLVWLHATNNVIVLGEESIRTKFISMPSNGDFTLLTVSTAYGVCMWDLENGTILRTISQYRVQRSEMISMSYDNETILLSEKRNLQMINIENGKMLLLLKELTPIMVCTLSPNGKIVAFALSNNILVTYDIVSNERLEYNFDRKGDEDIVMAVNNNGVICAVNSEPLVEVYTRSGVSKIVLHVSSILASPCDTNEFALLDNCGELHILHVMDKGEIVID